MIEAKSKDYAVFYLLAKYPYLDKTKIQDPYSMIPHNYPGLPVKPKPIVKGRKPLPIIVPRSIKISQKDTQTVIPSDISN